MSRRLCAIVLALLAMPSLAFADLTPYDQCVLQALRNNRNAASMGILKNACDKLYRGGAMLSQRDQAYYACLVQSLPGVEIDAAVQQILNICARQRRM
ncbi:MAG TPA: VF_A0006 family four-cysteine protein [Paraburkholderia sp.]|nr:VF_A0006 family four-cysteine protein [Paraburkholderia sp.]